MGYLADSDMMVSVRLQILGLMFQLHYPVFQGFNLLLQVIVISGLSVPFGCGKCHRQKAEFASAMYV